MHEKNLNQTALTQKNKKCEKQKLKNSEDKTRKENKRKNNNK